MSTYQMFWNQMNQQLFFVGKKLIASFILFVLFSCPIQAEPSIRLQVDSALMGVQPLDTIRRISKLPKSQLKSEGITIAANKQPGYDEVIHLKFDPVLKFHGVISTEVILAFDTPYENFHGLVYGLFTGDINKFVNKNGLKAGTPLNTTVVGVYNRPLDERPGCPITLGATPIDKNHFLFGPGWCNGD